MKLDKTINNYLLENLKDLFFNNKQCCNQFYFTITCCNNKNKWNFFNELNDLTIQLKTKHIIALNYYKSIITDCCLNNKKLVLDCCNEKKFFKIENLESLLKTILINIPSNNCNIKNNLLVNLEMTHIITNTLYILPFTRTNILTPFEPKSITILKGDYTFKL